MIIETGWNGRVSCYNNYSFDDGTNPEVPPPVEELNGACGSEDTEVEAYTGEGTVTAIDDVLPRSRTVNLSEEG